jgi:hypothetical protein
MGPDMIGNRVLKHAETSLTPIFTKLFNVSFQQSVFPSIWKDASVIPIHKKGSVNDCSNYRLVALTSCIAKVFEKCIFKYTFNYLRDNKLLSNFHTGFTPGHSTTNQLTYLYEFISKALDNGKEIRAVFCDISKAFDKVWHRGIIHKLSHLWINSNLLNWFKSYLENRKQRVVINGYKSDGKFILAGVPQGSVFGPLLFIIYINDIASTLIYGYLQMIHLCMLLLMIRLPLPTK